MSPALWAWSHLSFALLIANLLLQPGKKRRYLPLVVLCLLVPHMLGNWPLRETDLSGFVLAHTGTLSVPTLILLLLEVLAACGLTQPHCPRHRRNANFFWVTCGILVYPSALGFFPKDTYAFGYFMPMTWTVLALSGIAMFYRHKILANCLAAAVLVHQLKLLESPNLWDSLMDPWLCLVAAFQFVWSPLRKKPESLPESAS